jgi:hypothetical protein
MMRELPDKYAELIVSCENPHIINENAEIVEYKPCGCCPPCDKIVSTGHFGRGLSSGYRQIKLDQALGVLREYGKSGENGIMHRYDEKEGLEHFTIEYEDPLKMTEPYQLQIDFENMPDIGLCKESPPDDKIEAKEECYDVKEEKPQNG